MSSKAFTHTIRVRYSETDPQKFLFNARYLDYADVAMTEFFRDLGWPYPQMLASRFDPSVVQTSLEFIHPVRLDDLVDIEVTCTHVGRSSFQLAFSYSVSARPVCLVTSVYVNVDADAEASRPIPAGIATLLRSVAASDAQEPTTVGVNP
ncbi:thioesterase family protein [Arthrobacter globiformis]|uniref:acyl-CoA thioesterase n=1 Tax=Arthrobacter globiformis TaxID=1665 RepID=UPI00397CE775